MKGRWADLLRTHLEATSTLQALVAEECADAVDRAAMAIAESLRFGGKLTPSSVTAHVQESMLPIEHVMCHAIESELIPD